VSGEEKGAMLFVQGHFIPHQYTTEDGKQQVSLAVNVERFSFADGSKLEENGLGDDLACSIMDRFSILERAGDQQGARGETGRG
jgi:hypothetical protein